MDVTLIVFEVYERSHARVMQALLYISFYCNICLFYACINNVIMLRDLTAVFQEACYVNPQLSLYTANIFYLDRQSRIRSGQYSYVYIIVYAYW